MRNLDVFAFDDLLVTCSHEIINNGIETECIPDSIKDWFAGKVLRALPSALLKKLCGFLLENRDLDKSLAYKESLQSDEFTIRLVTKKKPRTQTLDFNELNSDPNIFEGAKVSNRGVDFAVDEMTVETKKLVPKQSIYPQMNTHCTPMKKATRAVFQPLFEMKLQKLKEKQNEQTDETNKKSISRSIRFREMPCPVCPTPPFRTQAKLFDHLKESHPKYWKENRPLTKAQKELSEMEEVNHDEITGFYNCSICGKQMNSATNMLRHVNSVHRNVKEITCEICSKSFSKVQNYERHSIDFKILKN